MHNAERIGAMRRGALFFITFLLTLAGLSAPLEAGAGTPAVGTLPGSFGVTATGAASYSIPIGLPRGAGGLTPSLALVYNSQSGSGAAGYGWTLSGLSAITRCNKTIHDDGATEGVQLSANDDYCLDGARLRLQSDGTWDTEIARFARITTTAGTNGPASFTMQTRDGMRYEYGVTADSRIHATGTQTVRVWALDKVSDANGNYYTISYQNNDTTTGDFWPLSVAYTGNTAAGTTPLHTVQFNWTPRATGSVTGRYLKGTLITQTQLLDAIEVRYSGSTTFTYALAYQTDTATGRNQLHTVTECAADGSCYQPTTIAWRNGTAGWQADTATGINLGSADFVAAAHLMDVDGDGVQDLLYPKKSAGGTVTDWWVLFGNPAGGFEDVPVDSGQPASTLYQYALAINFRGNGRTSLLYPADDNTWHVLDATGSRTAGSLFNDVATGISDTSNGAFYNGGIAVTDYWGHGLSDILYSDGANTYVLTNTAGGFAAPQVVASGGNWSRVGPMGGSIGMTRAFTDSSMAFDSSGRGGSVMLEIQTHTTPPCTPDYCPDPIPPTYTWRAFTPLGDGYAAAGAFTGDIAEPTPFPLNLKGDGTADLVNVISHTGYVTYSLYLGTGTALQSVDSVSGSLSTAEAAARHSFTAIPRATGSCWACISMPRAGHRRFTRPASPRRTRPTPCPAACASAVSSQTGWTISCTLCYPAALTNGITGCTLAALPIS